MSAARRSRAVDALAVARLPAARASHRHGRGKLRLIHPARQAGGFGNSSGNMLNLPGLVNLDCSVFKAFRMPPRQGTKLELRGELYNAANTPAFGSPVANIQAANAGRILSAGAARIAQLVLKVIF